MSHKQPRDAGAPRVTARHSSYYCHYHHHHHFFFGSVIALIAGPVATTTARYQRSDQHPPGGFTSKACRWDPSSGVQVFPERAEETAAHPRLQVPDI